MAKQRQVKVVLPAPKDIRDLAKQLGVIPRYLAMARWKMSKKKRSRDDNS